VDNPRSGSSSHGAPASSYGEATVALLERARLGDAAALDALFARYLGPLRRWARGRLPRWARDVSDTQDLVQETLLQTFKKVDTFEARGSGALQAYLRQAVMNRVRDELRRFDRRGPTESVDPALPAADESPLEQAIGRQNLERYERALSRLKPMDRELIVARVELGSSYEQLAEVLGKPSAVAARKAAQRAVVRLAAEIKREASGTSRDRAPRS
jgi:RNA polymerase sigma factor (sigma-70 family)